jgi:hypothetical protein
MRDVWIHITMSDVIPAGDSHRKVGDAYTDADCACREDDEVSPPVLYSGPCGYSQFLPATCHDVPGVVRAIVLPKSRKGTGEN